MARRGHGEGSIYQRSDGPMGGQYLTGGQKAEDVVWQDQKRSAGEIKDSLARAATGYAYNRSATDG